MTAGGDPVRRPVRAGPESRHELAEALRAVRAAVAGTGFPLRLPSAEPAAATATAVLAQIDDYALPRLTGLDTPMLVVVGGSTGAGKSTLVNSLVRAPVSAVGPLRPTTRAPLLACHPADAPWFRGDRVLGGLRRITGPAGPDAAGEPVLQLVAAPALPRGLAFLDAPDIDSVVAANRTLADQLFAAADLWLFVTTAARYADAVPWQLLHTAAARGTVVALVLSRVPPGATTELVDLLSGLLAGRNLADLPLFVLPETRIDRQGLLPEAATEPLRGWFDGLAADERARAGVIRCTLDGAVAALLPKLGELAAAAGEQLAAAEALAEQVGLAYGLARGTVERGVRERAPAAADGAPDPRPALAPAQEWARALRAMVGGWRDRAAALTGRPAGARHRRDAAESGLVTLVGSAAAEAAEQTDQAWRGHPAGAALLSGDHQVPSPELTRRMQQVLRQWPFDDLLARVETVLDAEAGRWLERLADAPLDGSSARRLREAAVGLERARVAAALTAELTPTVTLDPVLAPVPSPAEEPSPAEDVPAEAAAAGEPAVVKEVSE